MWTATLLQPGLSPPVLVVGLGVFATGLIEPLRLNQIESTVAPQCLADYAELPKTRFLGCALPDCAHSFAPEYEHLRGPSER